MCLCHRNVYPSVLLRHYIFGQAGHGFLCLSLSLSLSTITSQSLWEPGCQCKLNSQKLPQEPGSSLLSLIYHSTRIRPLADTSLLSLINERVKKAPKVSASKDTTRWRCMYEGLRGLSLVSFMNFE
jgi:hypothetical protein